LVVYAAVNFLCSTPGALCCEGLFTVSGSASEVEALKARFDRGEFISRSQPIFEGCSVANVAAVLKSFFRELPEPLMTFGMYDKIVEISTKTAVNSEIDIQALQKEVIEKL